MGYHFNVKFVSRGKGQSLVAKGAYQTRAKFREERTGEYKDYTYKNDGPVKSFVFVDKKHGREFPDIESLLNAIDRSETRANAQTALNFTVALPKELTDEARARMLRDFGREEFLRKGIPAIAHIHPPHEQAPAHDSDEHPEEEQANNGNHHAHILAGLRTLGPDGQFGDKHITWENYNERLAHWRERWAELGARYLENAGHKIEAERWRYGHLTNPQQREKALERGDHEWAEIKSREAGKHRGPNADAMERKGIETELGNAAREILEHNEDRATLHTLKRDLASLERQDAFEKLKSELTKADKVLAETRRAERERRPSRLAELNSQIFHGLLHEAVRHPDRLGDVQILAWRMPGDFVVKLNNAIAKIELIRHLSLNDLTNLIAQRQRHELEYQRAELDELKQLYSQERSPCPLPLIETRSRMDSAEWRASELDPKIFNGLLSHLIRTPERSDEIHMLAQRLPDSLLTEFQGAVEEHERVRNFQLADIKKLVAAYERQDLLQMDAEIKKMADAHRDREYARRDPVREQIEWEDAVAKAAIEKEKIDQRFLTHEDRDEARGGAAVEKLVRMYRGIGNNVWSHQQGEALFFSTDRSRAEAFGKLHYVDVTPAELTKFERPHSQRILKAEPMAKNDWKTADQSIIARLRPLEAENERSDIAEAEREYTQRDPVREQIAWEDAVAKAAIEKEKIEQRLIAKEDRERETWAGGKQAAPELGATPAQIRLARVLSPGPQSFANALEDRGLILACMTEADAQRVNKWESKRLGDKTTYKAGEFAVVNRYGDIFQLTPRNTGLNRDELPEYLKGIDRAPLLSVSAAQGVARAVRQHERQERQEAWNRKRAAALPKFGDILLSHAVKTALRDPRQQHGEPVSSAVFRDALEHHRLAFARVTPEEASNSYRSYREAQFAKEMERDMPDHAPVYQAGEIVIVRKDGPTATSRVHKLDQTKAQDYLRCLGTDKSQLQSIDGTKQTLDERSQMRQRAIDAAELRKARSPHRGGLVAQEKWAMRRVREAARQRQWQPYHPEEHAQQQRRREQEYRQRQDEEKRMRDGGDQLDAERYRTDPEYRRQVQQTQEWKSPEDKQRDRENAARAALEQQDRGR